MKSFFTFFALLFLAVLTSIYFAGYSSKMIRTSQENYSQTITKKVEELTVALDKATTEIAALQAENDALKATIATSGTKSKTTTVKKPTTTVTTKPVVVTPPKKTLTNSLVASHASQSDCWIIVDNKVYSVASYINMHPGGRSAIITECGKDATVAFTTQGGEGRHSQSAWSLLGQFLVGSLGDTLN